MMSTQVELLKHLRMVHFTLVGSSVILLVGSSATPSYLLENAYRQAQEIRRNAEKLVAWTVKRNHNVAEQIRVLNQESPIYLVNQNYGYKILGQHGTWHAPDESMGLSPNEEVNRKLIRLIQLRGGLGGGILIDRTYPAKLAKTLTDFSEYWNLLHQMNGPAVVTSLQIEKVTIEQMPDNTLDYKLSRDLAHAKEVLDIPNKLGFSIEHAKNGEWSLRIDFSQSYGSERRIGKLLPIKHLTIPMTVAKPQDDLQGEAIKALQVSWLPGTFDESFRELDRFATSIKSLTLDDLERHIDDLRSQTGHGIELFGARVSTDSLRTWGLLILVGVQGYFGLYLERYRRLPRQVLDEEFPWLGSYNWLPARITFAITASLLPLLATGVVMLTQSRSSRASDSVDLLLASWGSASFSIVLASLTLWQVIAIHRTRHGETAEDA